MHSFAGGVLLCDHLSLLWDLFSVPPGSVLSGTVILRSFADGRHSLSGQVWPLGGSGGDWNVEAQGRPGFLSCFALGSISFLCGSSATSQTLPRGPGFCQVTLTMAPGPSGHLGRNLRDMSEGTRLPAVGEDPRTGQEDGVAGDGGGGDRWGFI